MTLLYFAHSPSRCNRMNFLLNLLCYALVRCCTRDICCPSLQKVTAHNATVLGKHTEGELNRSQLYCKTVLEQHVLVLSQQWLPRERQQQRLRRLRRLQ